MRPRLIPILLLDRAKRLVKTIGFGERTYIGDPFNVVRLFNEKEVDELVVLDIDATRDGRPPDVGFVAELASECFMPLAFGGGLDDIRTCESLSRAGVEKLIIGTASDRPGFIRSLERSLGAQAVTVCVDCSGGAEAPALTHSGSRRLDHSALEHAKRVAGEGAGEILLQSVPRDGTRAGMDLETIRTVTSALDVPVIAAGGAGTVAHLAAALAAGASAAASGSSFCFIGRLRAVLVTYPEYGTELPTIG